VEQVEVIENFWIKKKEDSPKTSLPKFKLCIDMDCSFDIGPLHLGVNRRF